MAQHRSNQRIKSTTDNSFLSRRKLQARRGLHSRGRVFTIANTYPSSHGSVASSASPPPSPRAVLVPLQFNLRRLPSRLLLERKEMHDAVEVGTKRKRAVSGNGNENVQTNGRGSRTENRIKRRRGVPDSSDEETQTSAMEIDDRNRWDSDSSSDDEGALDSSDNYLINEAPSRQLLRLRKDELVRLYSAAGLTEDAELLTKHEIVDCIIAARDEVASLPPSSPPGLGDSASSDYSSDGGNVAGGEETDFGYRLRNGLRRRATLHDLGRPNQRTGTDRCFSMGELDRRERYAKSRFLGQPNISAQPLTRRRGLSNASSSHSSPTISMTSTGLPSPPATRTRSRTLSNEEPTVPSTSTKGKGKAKQVEFSEDVRIETLDPAQEESDLTDLTDLEDSLVPATPSPRRLRSKDKERLSSRNVKQKMEEEAEVTPQDIGRRVTPMRKAKGRVGSLKEDDTEDEEDELHEESEMDDEEDEVHELVVTPKGTPVRRTPLRRRLRSRRTHMLTPPSDGDDEDSDDEASVDLDETADADLEDGEEEDAGDDGETVREESEGEDEEEEAPSSGPKTLRNGKVVGEGELELAPEEDEGSEASQDQDEMASVDLDAEGDMEEGEDADEPMEDDVDLTVATAKTLVRLRRDDLVRLCETRDLEVSGTKPQLAEALLQWRDRHCSESASSPSSVGTARPPSTARPRGRRHTRSKSNSKTPPVLLRSERIHLDEPRTPPLSGRNKDTEPELELDLESLGLEDREIPPEKLTKLEKIGSGGFKDVYIGKFKGRRVAIAEFRGQLNAMDIKELKLLGDFDHPNIVRFLGVSIPENTRDTPVMIVSELCSNGDLFDYIRNVPPPTLYRALCIMADIARGLEYLHTRKPSVIHRDCKSSNILITSKGVAKITDFGLAKVKQSTRSMVRSLVGTVNWQAPELWTAHPKYNHKVDVFSCAMVFWEMLQWHSPQKKFPWEGMNEHAIYDIVGNKHQRPSVHGLRKQWCPEIVDLIEHMWAQDHHDRPTMTEVVREVERLVQKYR